MDLSAILWALIAGTAVGLLAKWVTPGKRDNIPLWLTILCGIGGVVLGNLVYTRIWVGATPGVDWWRHVWQVGAAAVLVSFAARRTAR